MESMDSRPRVEGTNFRDGSGTGVSTGLGSGNVSSSGHELAVAGSISIPSRIFDLIGTQKQERGKRGRYVWVDIDYVTDETWRRLNTILSRGSLVVQSGGRGGLHVYIRLDDWYPRDVFSASNTQAVSPLRRWRLQVQGQQPPASRGTLNHKGRAKGEGSYPVDTVR